MLRAVTTNVPGSSQSVDRGCRSRRGCGGLNGLRMKFVGAPARKRRGKLAVVLLCLLSLLAVGCLRADMSVVVDDSDVSVNLRMTTPPFISALAGDEFWNDVLDSSELMNGDGFSTAGVEKISDPDGWKGVSVEFEGPTSAILTDVIVRSPTGQPQLKRTGTGWHFYWESGVSSEMMEMGGSFGDFDSPSSGKDRFGKAPGFSRKGDLPWKSFESPRKDFVGPRDKFDLPRNGDDYFWGDGDDYLWGDEDDYSWEDSDSFWEEFASDLEEAGLSLEDFDFLQDGVDLPWEDVLPLLEDIAPLLEGLDSFEDEEGSLSNETRKDTAWVDASFPRNDSETTEASRKELVLAMEGEDHMEDFGDDSGFFNLDDWDLDGLGLNPEDFGFEFRFSVTLPGQPVDTNSDDVTSDGATTTASWIDSPDNLHSVFELLTTTAEDSQSPATGRAETAGGLGLSLVLTIIFGALLHIALITFVLTRNRQGKEAKPEDDSPPPDDDPHDSPSGDSPSPDATSEASPPTSDDSPSDASPASDVAGSDAVPSASDGAASDEPPPASDDPPVDSKDSPPVSDDTPPASDDSSADAPAASDDSSTASDAGEDAAEDSGDTPSVAGASGDNPPVPDDSLTKQKDPRRFGLLRKRFRRSTKPEDSHKTQA